MGNNTTEAQLIIRARQIGAQTIDATTTSLGKLNDQLAKQVQAAAKGEASSKSLGDTYNQLVSLGEKIIASQSAQIDRYNDLTAALDRAKAKAEELRAKSDAMAAAQANADKVTKTQAKSLDSLQRSADAADKKVVTATANLEKQSTVIQRLGGDVNNFAEFENRVAESVRNVGTAISASGELLEGYAEHLARVKEDEAFLKDDQAFLDRVAAVKRLAQSSQFFAEYEADLQRVAAAEKELAEVSAFNKTAEENARLREQMQIRQQLTAAFESQIAEQERLNSLQQFHATGTAGAATAAQVAGSTTAINTAPAPNSSLAASIQGILDPTAAARATLAGLESEVARVTAVVGEAEKPIREYQDAINDLARIQNAAANQAKLIDGYRNQQAIVTDLTGTYQTNLAAVQKRTTAIAASATVEDHMVEELSREQSALASSSAALSGQTEKLNVMGSALTTAGIDVNNLIAAEGRLRAASISTAAAVQKLSSAQSGRGGAGAGSFFGLKPYDIQNLGYQVNDLVTQISSGTSVMQAFAQQGGQIAQIPGVLKGIVAFLPEIAAGIAVLGTFYALFKRMYDLSANAREFNTAIKGTSDALNYNAQALAMNVRALQDLGIANSDAVAALKIFIHEGVDSTKLDQFTAAALALSRVMKIELPEAAKIVGEGFTGGFDAIMKLNDAYHFLSVAQNNQIRDDYNSGHAAQGRLTALNLFTEAQNKAAENARGPWSRAWTDLGIAFNAFLDFYTRVAGLHVIGDALAGIAKNAKDAAQWLARVSKPGSAPAGTPGAPGTAPVAGLGTGTGADTTQANSAQDIRSQNDLALFQRRITDGEKLNDQQRILNAGIDAYNAAQNHAGGALNDEVSQREKILAMEKERHAIALERTAEEQQLASQLKSSVVAAGAANPDDLGGQLAGNSATRDLQQKMIDDARTKGLDGLPQMGGMSLAQVSAVFDKQKQLADLQTTMNFYQTQQNELEKQYGDLVTQASSDYANHTKTAAQAAQAVKDAQALVLPLITANAAKATAFGKALNSANPSPRAEAFLANFANSSGNLLAKGTTDAMKLLDDAVTKAQDAQTTALKNIQDQFNEGAIDGSTAIQKAADAQARLTPEIVSAADAAADFAKAMNSVNPNAQLQGTIAKYQGISAGAGNTNAKSAVGKFDLGVVNADEQKLNATIGDRNALVQTYNELVEAGVMTQADAEAKTKALYEETSPVIQQQIADIQKMLDTLRGQSGANLPVLDELAAKLQLAGSQALYVDKNVQELGKEVNNAIENQTVQAFDSASTAIGNAIAGTEKWGDAFSDLGRSAANFFAGLLKDVAEAILKMEILQALGISGTGGGSSAGGGFGGAVASMLLGGGGGGAAAATSAGDPFNLAAEAAATGGSSAEGAGGLASIMSWAAALFHGGTSSSGQMTRTNQHPSLWDNAPRYHTGTPGVGLSDNEQRAILLKNEEVLTADNPRHIKNMGKGSKGAASQDKGLKQVLAIHPDDITGLMATSQGRDVTLTHIRVNAPTIKQMLGIKS